MVEQPSQDAKEVLLWSRGRTWVNIAVRPCLHSFLTHNKHQPFENKVWEIYIFIKKRIRSLLKSPLPVNDVSAYKCIFVYVHVQLYCGYTTFLNEKGKKKTKHFDIYQSYWILPNYVFCNMHFSRTMAKLEISHGQINWGTQIGQMNGGIHGPSFFLTMILSSTLYTQSLLMQIYVAHTTVDFTIKKKIHPNISINFYLLLDKNLLVVVIIIVIINFQHISSSQF